MHEQQPQEPRTPEKDHDLHPRIWIGSARDIEEGQLHGAWLDATQPVEQLTDQVAAMLWAAPLGPGALDTIILDHADFAGIDIDEHEDLHTISALGRALADYGPPFGAWVQLQRTHDVNPDVFHRVYLGRWDSLTEFAADLLVELGYEEHLDRTVPKHVRPYVRLDGTTFANELVAAGHVTSIPSDDDGVWVFDSREQTQRGVE